MGGLCLLLFVWVVVWFLFGVFYCGGGLLISELGFDVGVCDLLLMVGGFWCLFKGWMVCFGC